MAKPNYSFEKRQRELAKKKKKEEKLKEKAGRKSGAPHSEDGSDGADATEQGATQESTEGVAQPGSPTPAA